MVKREKRTTDPFRIHVCRECQCIIADDHWDRHPRECRGYQPLVITEGEMRAWEGYAAPGPPAFDESLARWLRADGRLPDRRA
jgi:hypothetical protein